MRHLDKAARRHSAKVPLFLRRDHPDQVPRDSLNPHAGYPWRQSVLETYRHLRRSAMDRHQPVRRRARLQMPSNASRVNVPVKVFCWLG